MKWFQRVAAGLVAALGLAVPSIAQDEPSPAQEAAKHAFERMKEGDLEGFAAALDPEDLKGFATMVVDMVKAAEKGGDPNAKALIDGLGGSSELEKSEPAAVAARFIKSMTSRIPGYDDLMKQANLKMIGEVPIGPDSAAVVYEFALPTPQAVVVGKKDDRWYVMLDPTYKLMASTLKRVASGGAPPDPTSFKLESIEVLGSLPDGEERTNLVIRSKANLGGEAVERVAVVPVSKDDPEWALLAPEKKAEMEAALKKKFAPPGQR